MHGAVRDRVLAIYVLGIFVVCFWAAFEQAGNVLNIWADKFTDRGLIVAQPPPAVFTVVKDNVGDAKDDTEVGLGDRFSNMFKLKPSIAGAASDSKGAEADSRFIIPTTWFQSINALAIFVLAPLFAFMWTASTDGARIHPYPPRWLSVWFLWGFLSS